MVHGGRVRSTTCSYLYGSRHFFGKLECLSGTENCLARGIFQHIVGREIVPVHAFCRVIRTYSGMRGAELFPGSSFWSALTYSASKRKHFRTTHGRAAPLGSFVVFRIQFLCCGLSKPRGFVGTTAPATTAAYVLPLGYSICRLLSPACSPMILAVSTDRVAGPTSDSGPGVGRLVAGSVESSALAGVVLLLPSSCFGSLREVAIPPGVVRVLPAAIPARPFSSAALFSSLP